MATNFDDLTGQNGLDYFADTSAHTVGGGKSVWTAIRATGGAAVVASITVENGSNVTTITSFSLVQGEVLAGQFTGITLTSGKVICYRSNQ